MFEPTVQEGCSQGDATTRGAAQDVLYSSHFQLIAQHRMELVEQCERTLIVVLSRISEKGTLPKKEKSTGGRVMLLLRWERTASRRVHWR